MVDEANTTRKALPIEPRLPTMPPRTSEIHPEEWKIQFDIYKMHLLEFGYRLRQFEKIDDGLHDVRMHIFDTVQYVNHIYILHEANVVSMFDALRLTFGMNPGER